MSDAGNPEVLREQRDQQIALLRGHVENLVAAPRQPAAWVGDHPYVATLGAAAAGFMAARFAQPPAQEEPAGHWHRRRREPEARHDRGRPRRPRESMDSGGWLEILCALASPLLASLINPSKDACAAQLRVGDAGSTAGSTFPGAFSAANSGAAARATTSPLV